MGVSVYHGLTVAIDGVKAVLAGNGGVRFFVPVDGDNPGEEFVGLPLIHDTVRIQSEEFLYLERALPKEGWRSFCEVFPDAPIVIGVLKVHVRFRASRPEGADYFGNLITGVLELTCVLSGPTLDPARDLG